MLNICVCICLWVNLQTDKNVFFLPAPKVLTVDSWKRKKSGYELAAWSGSDDVEGSQDVEGQVDGHWSSKEQEEQRLVWPCRGQLILIQLISRGNDDSLLLARVILAHGGTRGHLLGLLKLGLWNVGVRGRLLFFFEKRSWTLLLVLGQLPQELLPQRELEQDLP